jgi:hypothetical protein
VAACERVRANRKMPERWVRPFWGYMLWRRRAAMGARGLAKSAVLGIFKLMGKRFVYDLNTR